MVPYRRQPPRAPAPDAPALGVHELSVRYPGAERPALERVSFVVGRGEKVALIGPNGAGKSTLIKSIVGQVMPQAGRIALFGQPAHAQAGRMAYLPQRSEVNWRFPVSVAEVVMMGRYPHLGWIKRPRPVDHAAVAEALEALNLASLATRKVGELSGGQQQRVMLARALAQEADLVLLDEPLNNVDVRTQALIFDILDHLAVRGKAILVSTHDLGTLQTEFNRALFLDRAVIADGPVEQVINPELLARAYGISPHVCPPELLAAEGGR